VELINLIINKRNMERVECPICGCLFAKSVISAHVDRCLDETHVEDEEFASDMNLSWDSKRPRVDQDTETTFCSSPRFNSPALCDLILPSERTPLGVVPSPDFSSSSRTSAPNTKSADVSLSARQSSTTSVQASVSKMSQQNTKSASLLGYFTASQKAISPKKHKTGGGSGKLACTPWSDQMLMNKRTTSPDSVSGTAFSREESKPVDVAVSRDSTAKHLVDTKSSAVFVPLAERMRPTTLSDFVGQGHVVGSQRPLRTLLESAKISSMILWGPPGCGKVAVINWMYLR